MHQSEGKVVHGVPEFGKFELMLCAPEQRI